MSIKRRNVCGLINLNSRSHRYLFILFIYLLRKNTLQWRHSERDGVSNHQPHDCLFKHLFRRRSKKTSMLRVTGLCEGNSPVTGEFPAQRSSNAENVSIWWRHYEHHFKVNGMEPTQNLQHLPHSDPVLQQYRSIVSCLQGCNMLGFVQVTWISNYIRDIFVL